MTINRTPQLRYVALAACLSLGLAACGSVHTTRRPILVRATVPEAPAPMAKIDISEKIRFRLGSATLLSESHEVLGEVVTAMQENTGIRVEVQGYTDTKGSERKNRKLSQQRADAVREFLIEQGIDGDRLTARGFGPDSPIADNDTHDGRVQNRRVEFVILEQTAPNSVALGDSQ